MAHMSALDQYLAETGESATSFAGRVGCDVSTIVRIRQRKYSPNVELAKKIIDATGGRLSFEDLIAHAS